MALNSSTVISDPRDGSRRAVRLCADAARPLCPVALPSRRTAYLRPRRRHLTSLPHPLGVPPRADLSFVDFLI